MKTRKVLKVNPNNKIAQANMVAIKSKLKKIGKYSGGTAGVGVVGTGGAVYAKRRKAAA